MIELGIAHSYQINLFLFSKLGILEFSKGKIVIIYARKTKHNLIAINHPNKRNQLRNPQRRRDKKLVFTVVQRPGLLVDTEIDTATNEPTVII